MFFQAKREEAGAVSQFKQNCTYHGLTVRLSVKALTALKTVITAGLKGEEADIGERDMYVLARRGMIRVARDGAVTATQIGLLVIALAEAGDLVTIRTAKEKA